MPDKKKKPKGDDSAKSSKSGAKAKEKAPAEKPKSAGKKK